ncbi:MAG: hypothetical protein ACPGSD_15785 [Flavobacteriales bacterium]
MHVNPLSIKFRMTLFVIFQCIFHITKGQVGIGTTNPHPSSILEINSQTKGFLPPRLTVQQRSQIQNPTEGLLIYCTNCCDNLQGSLNFYNGEQWRTFIDCGSSDIDQDGILNSLDLDDDNDGILDINENLIIADPGFENPINNTFTSNSYNEFNIYYGTNGAWKFVENGLGSPSGGLIKTGLNFPDGGTPNFQSPIEGTNAVVFHSHGNYAGEALYNNLQQPLIQGGTYEFYFHAYAHRFTVPIPSFVGNGKIIIYGIKTGEVISSFNQSIEPSLLDAQPNIYIRLGETSEIVNDGNWEQYGIQFTAQENIDRLLIVIDGTNAMIAVDNFTCNADPDGDGIFSQDDIDSDGDGCPDAIEGTANFNTSHLTINQNLSGDIDVNGVPVLAGSSGQLNGYSQTPLFNYCLDTDNDGVPNIVDLDDDNDGIPDNKEGVILSDPSFENPLLTNFSMNDYESFNTAYTNPSNVTWEFLDHGNGNPWGGLFKNGNSNPNGTNNDLQTTDGSYKVIFHSDGNFNGEALFNNLTENIISGGHYVFKFSAYSHLYFPVPSVNFNGQGKMVIYGIKTGAIIPNFTGSYTTTVLNGFANIYSKLGETELINNTSDWKDYGIQFTATEDYDRILIIIDGFDAMIGVDNFICSKDTDGDGIFDSEDLDSDQDGCPDAMEASANLTSGQLNPNGAISSHVNPNTGIPSAVGNGQENISAYNSSLQDPDC